MWWRRKYVVEGEYVEKRMFSEEDMWMIFEIPTEEEKNNPGSRKVSEIDGNAGFRVRGSKPSCKA
jgi:hypothetical protein